MQKTNALSEWTVKFMDKISPRGFIIESPWYIELHNQSYMQGLSQTHVAYCAYGKLMQKPTTPFHKGNLKLELETYLYKGPHRVTFAKNYGGAPCCRRWTKNHLKSESPPELATNSFTPITNMVGYFSTEKYSIIPRHDKSCTDFWRPNRDSARYRQNSNVNYQRNYNISPTDNIFTGGKASKNPQIKKNTKSN